MHASIEGRVLVTELSGSESVIHFDMNGQTWVSQSHGIHPFEVGSTAKLYVDVDQSFFFDGNDRLIGGACLMAKITLDGAPPQLLWPDPQRDEDWALKKLSLELADGGAYALLGPSGCGKTTLLNLISGLLHADRRAHPVRRQRCDATRRRNSATSRRCSSFRSSTTR